MYEPYPYQIECLEAIQHTRDESSRRALIVMASGLGKTVTMAFDAKAWRKQNGGRVLFLCHNNDILYQAKTTFQAVNGLEQTYGYLHGERKDLSNTDFLFASFQTIERYLDLFRPDEFSYVVVDESHHSQASTYRSTIEYFKPKFLLGATATPDRLDQLDIRELFGREIFYLPLEEAVARSLVTPLDYRLMTDEIQLSQVLETEQGRLSIAYLNRKIFIPRRDEEIAKIINHHVSEFKDPRIIIFCASIKHCEHLAQFTTNSFIIHSLVPQRERAIKLEMFRQGIVSTVLTVDCFNEGIDIPQANAVVFLRSTTSNTIFLQQLGRGLRRSDGKDKVIVLDFVANCERIKMVHKLWIGIEDRINSNGNERQNNSIIQPMTLNVDSVDFKETIIPLFKLLDRIKPLRIIEIANLLEEYSPKNVLPSDKAMANTLARYWWICKKCGYEWRARSDHRVRGAGCPACSGRVATEKNNLAATHPEIAKEYSSRNDLPVNQIVAGTHKKLWWKCFQCNHEWQAKGYARINGSNCPACAGQIATENNNLAVRYTQLADEYSPKNDLPVNQISAGTHKKIWWLCKKCGCEWQAPPEARVRGNGCPGCANRILTSKNNLAIVHPDLIKYYSSRNKLPPDKVIPTAKNKLWWKCNICGHEWQASAYLLSKGSGCQMCALAKMRKNKKEKKCSKQIL